MNDPHDLQRFVDAQDAGGTYDDAVAELRAGRKQSHWMWFVFPQIAGLGSSPTSRHYAVKNLDEATAYVEHPLLGERLRQCAGLLLAREGTSATAVFGSIDAQKLQSSMTLFARADPAEPVFPAVLDRYFSGEEDRGTLSRL